MYYFLKSAIRRENFGGILASEIGNIESVNHTGMLVLDAMMQNCYTIKEIVENLKINSSIDASDSFVFQSVEEFLTDLVKGGFVERSQNRCKNSGDYILFKNETNNENILQNPFSSIINITNKCNQRCEFCYHSRDTFFLQKEEMSTEQLLRAAEILVNNGTFTLNLLGGEPLIRFEDMMAIFHMVSQKNKFCHCTFASNGSYEGGLSLEKCEELTSYRNSSIRVSLQGLNDKHDKRVRLPGAFDSAVKTIKNIMKANPSYRISIVLTVNSDIIKEIDNIVEYCVHVLGVHFIEFSNIQPVGSAKENNIDTHIQDEERVFEHVMELNVRYNMEGALIVYGGRYFTSTRPFKLGERIVSCSIPNQIVVDPYGDCYFCHMTTGMHEFCGGNILSEDINHIWNSKLHNDMAKMLNDCYEGCKTCQNFSSCQGGCRMAAFLTKGDYLSADPICYRHYI